MLAQGLSDAGNYDAAITEYERFICLTPDSSLRSTAWLAVSRCNRELGHWDAAIDALRRAADITGDSLRNVCRVETGIVNLAAGRYSAAEIDLLRTANFARQPTARRRASLVLGVCDLYEGKWDEARRAFNAAFDSTDPRRRAVDSLLSPRVRPAGLSPSLAKWLSTFLPGAGQFYAGDWKNGFNALILNGATGYLLVDRLLAQDWVTIFLSSVSQFQRYYLGQRLRAEQIAQTRNELAARHHATRIIEIVRAGEN